jgi:hypothetical protein
MPNRNYSRTEAPAQEEQRARCAVSCNSEQWLIVGCSRALALRECPGGATGTYVGSMPPRGGLNEGTYLGTRPTTVGGMLLLCDNIKRVVNKTAPRIRALPFWALPFDTFWALSSCWS